jgi:hypothetical protein
MEKQAKRLVELVDGTASEGDFIYVVMHDRVAKGNLKWYEGEYVGEKYWVVDSAGITGDFLGIAGYIDERSAMVRSMEVKLSK